jgi:membrane protein YdbS with pleckstrin-like domain
MTDPQRHEHRQGRHLRTPTSQLSHEQKLRRQERHIEVLSGALILVLAMLAYAAIFDLDHPAEWVVFAGICVTALGAMIALRTR